MWFVFVDMHLFKSFGLSSELVYWKEWVDKWWQYVQVLQQNIMYDMRRWPARYRYVYRCNVPYSLLVGDTEITCDIDCALRLRWKRDYSISKIYSTQNCTLMNIFFLHIQQFYYIPNLKYKNGTIYIFYIYVSHLLISILVRRFHYQKEVIWYQASLFLYILS